MNGLILLLSVYFFVTGAIEFFSPHKANRFYEKCIQIKEFRLFSIWAFVVGAVAYFGMPVAHLKWFVLFLIWLYGVMGFWILLSPHSFLKMCQKAYFKAAPEGKMAMVRFDGFFRFIVALLLFFAAQ